MSHNLKGLEQELTAQRDKAHKAYQGAVDQEKFSGTFGTQQRGAYFGQKNAYMLALDLLHIFTDGEFGQRFADQVKPQVVAQ